MINPKARVLVVDDERRYRDLVQMNLCRTGYTVALASDGLGALNAVEADEPDLVVLDLMLPDMDGYDVCRRIREYSAVPIIMLTARAEPPQKVRGLQLGADDYLTKPFGADELLARIEAVLRRTRQRGIPVPAVLSIGQLTLDASQHLVTLAGQEVDLSPKEYRLLHELMANAGRVLIQDDLLQRVWGDAYEGEPQLLHTAVRRLRQRVEDNPAQPRYVLTKRGIGYWVPKEPLP